MRSKNAKTATGRDSAGHRHYASGRTKKEAKEKLARLLDDAEQKLLNEHSYTLSEIADIYLESAKKRVRSTTYPKRERAVNKIIKESFIADIQIDRITKHDCQSVIDAQSGKSKYWICLTRSLLKNMFKTAIELDIIHNDPTTTLSVPRGDKHYRRSLTRKEQIAFLKGADFLNSSLEGTGTFFKILYYCGLRPSEASNLLVSDIIEKTDKEYSQLFLRVRNGKTIAARRTVPVPCIFADELRQKSNGRSGEEYLIKTTRIRHRLPNLKMDETHIRTDWNKIRKRMIDFGISQEDVKDITPYSLRHTYCTNLASAGVDIRRAQYLMGHEDIKMTANIYTHHTEDAEQTDWLEINNVYN